jgi:hypothetical protein
MSEDGPKLNENKSSVIDNETDRWSSDGCFTERKNDWTELTWSIDRIWNAAEVRCTTQVVAFSSAQWGFRFQVTGEHNLDTITNFQAAMYEKSRWDH